VGERPPAEAVRLLNGFRGYQLALAACRLNLPDLVAAGHSDPDGLAVQTGVHAGALRRMLRGLVAWGFFAHNADGRLVSTFVSDAFRSDRPGLRNITLMLGNEGYRAWGELMYTLKTGEPVFEHIYGKSRWQKMAEDPDDAAQFNAAMVEITSRVARAFIARYDFEGIETVVDVAGGNGALLTAILKAYPTMKGILFDLPAGLAGADQRMKAEGLDGRVTFVEGSFFESIPRSGDLYLLKSIVHDWDDDQAAAILARCRMAMSASSKLVVLERYMPDEMDSIEDALGTVMSDLHMMVVLGGAERTTAEYASLLAAAGLRLTQPITMDSEFYAIEAVPD
jgi:hypothetical protein